MDWLAAAARDGQRDTARAASPHLVSRSDAAVPGATRETLSPGNAETATAAPVGVAVAGLVSPDGKIIERAVNLEPLEGAAFVRRLESRLQRRVQLFTDAHAATWAEYLALPPPGPAHFLHLRLGTGACLGEVIDGRYASPQRFGRFHPDLLIADAGDSAIPCRCGRTGCLEAYLSAARDRDDPAVRREAWRAVRIIVDRLCEHLALARSAKGAILSIGGGWTNDADLMAVIASAGLEPDAAFAAAAGNLPARVSVRRSKTGDHAAAIGAAMLATGDEDGGVLH